MKKNICIWLISALWEDVVSAVAEHAEWKNFVSNTGVMTGKGPSVLSHKLKVRKQMHDLADSIIDALKQGRVDSDFFKHHQPEKYFIASAAAKHHVPRSYPISNPTQGSVTAQRNKEKSVDKSFHTHGRGRGHGWRRGASTVGKGTKPSVSSRHKTSRPRDYTEEAELERGTLEEVTEVNDADLANVLAQLTDESDMIENNVTVFDLENEENILSQQTQTAHLKGSKCLSSSKQLHTNWPQKIPERTRRGRNWHYEDPNAYSSDEEPRHNEENIVTKQRQSSVLNGSNCSSSGNQLITDDIRRNPQRRRQGRNWHYEDPEAYSSDEELRHYDKLHPTPAQEATKLVANPPTYCFLWCPTAHLRPPIKKQGYKQFPERCNGCLIPFADQLYDDPGKNLVFRFKTYRQFYSLTSTTKQNL